MLKVSGHSCDCFSSNFSKSLFCFEGLGLCFEGNGSKTHKVVQYFYTMFPSVECVRGHDDMVPFIVSGKNTYCRDHHFLLLIASSGLRA
jgi:hypothetical protein